LVREEEGREEVGINLISNEMKVDGTYLPTDIHTLLISIQRVDGSWEEGPKVSKMP
jgi:hypothetical protein